MRIRYNVCFGVLVKSGLLIKYVGDLTMAKNYLLLSLLLLVGLAGVTNAALIGFQAESGTLGVDFDPPIVDPDGLALGGQYITIETPGAGGAPNHEDRIATYTVTFPEAGTYDLYGRLFVETANENAAGQGAPDNDSMFYGNGLGTKPPTSADAWIMCNSLTPSAEWFWINLSGSTGSAGEGAISFEVPAGELTQTFQIGAREDGLRIDAFVFVTSTLSPTDVQLDAAVPQETKAFGAEPTDGSTVSVTSLDLSWEPGVFATNHHVYLSAEFSDVNERTEQADKGLTNSPTYYVSELVPGTLYYWAVDEVSGSDIWPGEVWSFKVQPQTASDPDPYDGEISVGVNDVFAWLPGISAVSRMVYLDAARENVEARSGCLVNGVSTTEPSYSPGPLDFDTTYYWAVDEIGSSPDNTTYAGEVWSFTTMPDIQISDADLIGWWMFDEGDGRTALDWSGHGNHGAILGNPDWVAGYNNSGNALYFDGLGDFVDCGNDEIFNITDQITVAAWIRVNVFEQTDQAIVSKGETAWKLVRNGLTTDQLRFDCGAAGEAIGNANVNDGQWHHAAGTYNGSRISLYVDGVADGFAAGSGPITADPNLTLWIADNNRPGEGPQAWNGLIDDVRIYNVAKTQEEIELMMRGNPLIAWNPNPVNGLTLSIEQSVSLSWSPGDNAAQHDVYFGTDEDAVDNADASDTTGIYRGRQDSTTYTPDEELQWGQTYYWRVDEVEADGTVNRGYVWSFTIADYLVVEDFEDYNDYPPDEVWNTWLDGYMDSTNGSTAGYPDPDFVMGEHYLENVTVHEGQWSMPLFYDNSSAGISEVTRTITSTTRDWTRQGVGVLTLFYYGDQANTTEQMFVAVDNVVVNNDDINAARVNIWTQWDIPLQVFADQGVNLNSVGSITIGFGNRDNPVAGGEGHVFFDDIRLYRE
jgi:hypothetical protein